MSRFVILLLVACLGWNAAHASADQKSTTGNLSLLHDADLLENTYWVAQNYTEFEDVVYLKNGSVIRGMVIEQIPSQQLKIQTKDGSVFVFKMDEIDKITKEKTYGVHDTRGSGSYGKGFRPDKLRSPGGAFVLSFLILPGIGQYYNGAYIPRQHIKGAIFTVTYVVGLSLMIAGITECTYYGGCPAGMIWGGWLMSATSRWWSSADAAIVAGRINRREYDVEEVNPNRQDRYDGGQKISLLPMIRLSSAGSSSVTPTYGLQASYAF